MEITCRWCWGIKTFHTTCYFFNMTKQPLLYKLTRHRLFLLEETYVITCEVVYHTYLNFLTPNYKVLKRCVQFMLTVLTRLQMFGRYEDLGLVFSPLMNVFKTKSEWMSSSLNLLSTTRDFKKLYQVYQVGTCILWCLSFFSCTNIVFDTVLVL